MLTSRGFETAGMRVFALRAEAEELSLRGGQKQVS